MSDHNVKQVIVVRKDLNMRKGKIAAQAAHASMKVFLDLCSVKENRIVLDKGNVTQKLSKSVADDMFKWLNEGFTKVVVSADSEKEMMDIYHLILQTSDVPVALILDAGKTEFNGVATYTCIAVGPAEASKVDAFTGKLKLL